MPPTCLTCRLSVEGSIPFRSAMTCSLEAGRLCGSLACRQRLCMISCRWVTSVSRCTSWSCQRKHSGDQVDNTGCAWSPAGGSLPSAGALRDPDKKNTVVTRWTIMAVHDLQQMGHLRQQVCVILSTTTQWWSGEQHRLCIISCKWVTSTALRDPVNNNTVVTWWTTQATRDLLWLDHLHQQVYFVILSTKTHWWSGERHRLCIISCKGVPSINRWSVHFWSTTCTTKSENMH